MSSKRLKVSGLCSKPCTLFCLPYTDILVSRLCWPSNTKQWHVLVLNTEVTKPISPCYRFTSNANDVGLNRTWMVLNTDFLKPISRCYRFTNIDDDIDSSRTRMILNADIMKPIMQFFRFTSNADDVVRAEHEWSWTLTWWNRYRYVIALQISTMI